MSIIDEFDRELARCDREIAEIQSRPGPDAAYLTTLGISDWQYERRLIEHERATVSGGCDGARI